MIPPFPLISRISIYTEFERNCPLLTSCQSIDIIKQTIDFPIRGEKMQQGKLDGNTLDVSN